MLAQVINVGGRVVFRVFPLTEETQTYWDLSKLTGPSQCPLGIRSAPPAASHEVQMPQASQLSPQPVWTSDSEGGDKSI